MTRRWRLGLAAAGVVMVVLAARRLDVRALGDVLRTIDPRAGVGLALLAMALVIGAKLWAKAMRSQVLLEASARRLGLVPPTRALTHRLLIASHAAGQLAWGPLGFTVRTLALRDLGMPLRAVARVHVEERVAEAAGIAVIATASLVVGAGHPTWIARALTIGLAIAAGLALAIAAGLALAPRLRARLAGHGDRARPLAASSAWALASSVAELAILWVAARAAGATLDAPTTMLAFLVLAGASAVPLTPAQVGVQESALVVVFTTGGVAAPVALAAALVYRVVHVVPLAVLGVPALVAQRRARPG